MNTAASTVATAPRGATPAFSPGGAADASRRSAGQAPAEGADPLHVQLFCPRSISGRLSRKLALFTIIVIGLLSLGAWMSVGMLMEERSRRELDLRTDLMADVIAVQARIGGEPAVIAWLHSDAPMRSTNTRLQVWNAAGDLLFADPGPVLSAGNGRLVKTFTIETPALAGGFVTARYTLDQSAYKRMGTRWAAILVVVTLAAGAVVAIGAGWHVRRSLKPLRELAAQTLAISPQHLDQRLSLASPAGELSPLVEQFNALMARLERAYVQLEGFNADVAHELRTPLAALIGETEVALSRERSPAELRDTLASNLEEMQRLSAMVNDMLFLSNADRGAVARRGAPTSLAALAHQVCEFHEATLEEAGLTLRVEGDAVVAVDEPLFKRAVSNLLGNARRFAEPGSVVVLRIQPAAASAADPAGQVQVEVCNRGEPIEPSILPRLFDRFFRGEESRCCPNEVHHGLGLAIVAAIARMHAGRTLAECHGGTTRVGFTLATA
jgi:two-component system heavy metal sensor histidine kinase CusS